MTITANNGSSVTEIVRPKNTVIKQKPSKRHLLRGITNPIALSLTMSIMMPIAMPVFAVQPVICELPEVILTAMSVLPKIHLKVTAAILTLTLIVLLK